METSNNKEFLHGLQEYCRYKGSTETETKVKQVLDILYSDDIESAVIDFLLTKFLDTSKSILTTIFLSIIMIF